MICYDVFKTYMGMNCDGAQVLVISRVVIVVFGLLRGGLGISLNHVISVGVSR